MSDGFEFWRARLADPSVPFPETGLPLGYWKQKRNDQGGARNVPIGVWRDESEAGALVVQFGSKAGKVWLLEPDKILDWHENPWWLGQAVTYDDYIAAFETGEWPDHSPARIGHNKPPEDSITGGDQVESVAALLEARLADPADSQDWADAVANLRDRLRSIATDLTEMRKAEESGPKETLAAIKAKYTPILDRAEALGKRAAERLADYLTKQREAVADKIAEATAAGASPEEINEMLPRAGTGKRRVGMRGRKVATIKDYALTLHYFANDPAVVKVVQSLANKAVKAGGNVPGVEVEKKETAA